MNGRMDKWENGSMGEWINGRMDEQKVWIKQINKQE